MWTHRKVLLLKFTLASSPYCIRQIYRKPSSYPVVSWNSNLPAMFSARQRSCRQVMFSVVSVHQSVILFHVNITCDALDLTGHGSPSPLDMEPHWTETPVTSSSHPWRPVQTFSLQDPPSPGNWSCHLLVIKVPTVGVSGQYASYSNISLLRMLWAYFNYFPNGVRTDKIPWFFQVFLK